MIFTDDATLEFLCQNKYIAVYYDKTGVPLRVINQRRHLYRFYCEQIKNHSLGEIFLLPDVDDLNKLFVNPPEATQDAALFPLKNENITNPIKLSGTIEHKYYESRNIFENNGINCGFFYIYPLSNICLFRVEENKFIGIIILKEEYYHIRSFGDTLCLILSSDERIIGYSRGLSDLLRCSTSGELLDVPLSRLLSPDSSQAGIGMLARPQKSNISSSWEAGSSWSFPDQIKSAFNIICEQGKIEIQSTDNGALLRNLSTDGYLYLRLNKGFSTDKNDVRVELEFISIDQSMPNIILSGNNMSMTTPWEIPPDLNGYGFSRIPQAEGFSYVIKKAGKMVRVISGRAYRPEEVISIGLEKCGNCFKVKENGVVVGEWLDPQPFIMEGESGCYLFIKPGNGLILRKFHVFTATKASVAIPDPNNGFFTLHYSGTEYTFRTAIIDNVWYNQNIKVMILTNVSDIKADLETVRREQKKLKKLFASGGFIGVSPGIRALRKAIPVIAESNLTVLIEGETGTGKEVLAHELHAESPRHDKPFVKLDCSAIPENLMESEFFGHKKGAFTGAASDYAGRFEQAQGGTLFLDEIGNIPISIQTKLLGVLQDFQIQRVGGTQKIPLDLRVIAATNSPLRALMERGLFREDLFYRINQYRFELPPLRERQEDIPLLSDSFIKEGNVLFNKQVVSITAEAMDMLLRLPWRGNIRELKSVIFKAMLFCHGSRLNLTDFSIEPEVTTFQNEMLKTGKQRSRGTLDISLEKMTGLLTHHKGNLRALEKELKLSRPSVYKILMRYNLNPNAFREHPLRS